MITTVDMATDLVANQPLVGGPIGLDESLAILAGHMASCRAWRLERLAADEDGSLWMETHTPRRVRRLRAANRRGAVLALLAGARF